MEHQYLNQPELHSFQENEFLKTLAYVAENSAFYKKLFKEKGIAVSEIKSLSDLHLLPFTHKEDIQLYNDDFICVSKDKIIDYVTSSGTTGTPITLALTDKDLERLATNEANSFQITGGSASDIYQLMVTMDRRFMAGMAYFLGARKLGAGIVRVGNGIPELQWDTIQRIQPTAIICVPSFILKLIEYAKQNGIDYQNSSIKKAICVGEPLRNDDFTLNQLSAKIKEQWDIELFSSYASSEMGAAFTECSAGKGGHLQPNLLLMEIVDENGQAVPDGEYGELVVSTLGVEGMPLLRFKTGDICCKYTAICSCGRTTPRLSPILGRKKHMIKYKGTSLFPEALYDILDHLPEVKTYQVLVSTNSIGTDDIKVKIGVNLGDEKAGEKLEKEIKDHFRAKLRVAPSLEFCEPKELIKAVMPETSRKPIKFVDLR